MLRSAWTQQLCILLASLLASLSSFFGASLGLVMEVGIQSTLSEPRGAWLSKHCVCLGCHVSHVCSPASSLPSQTTEHFSKASHSFCCRRNELESKLLEPAFFRAGGIWGPLVEPGLGGLVAWEQRELGWSHVPGFRVASETQGECHCWETET